MKTVSDHRIFGNMAIPLLFRLCGHIGKKCPICKICKAKS